MTASITTTLPYVLSTYVLGPVGGYVNAETGARKFLEGEAAEEYISTGIIFPTIFEYFPAVRSGVTVETSFSVTWIGPNTYPGSSEYVYTCWGYNERYRYRYDST